MFTPVSKQQSKLRMALDGPTGAGKTYTALRLAFALAGPDGKVGVIDTEHGRAALYKRLAPDGIPWLWENCNMQHFAPSEYEAVIVEAGRRGYDVLVIDSLSHAWQGVGGALEQVDKAGATAAGGKFGAWRDVTPQHNGMIEAIMGSPCHIIATMRSKMEHVLEPNEQGKMTPRKVGLRPIQRDGVEYEFDIVGDMDLQHTMTVSKSRCSAVDGKVVNKPSAGFMVAVKDWLLSEDLAPAEPVAADPAAAAPVVLSPAQPAQVNGQPARILLSTVTRCDLVLANEIKDLWRSLGRDVDSLRQTLAQKGASKVTDLALEDARGLASILRKRTLDKEGTVAF